MAATITGIASVPMIFLLVFKGNTSDVSIVRQSLAIEILAHIAYGDVKYAAA